MRRLIPGQKAGGNESSDSLLLTPAALHRNSTVEMNVEDPKRQEDNESPNYPMLFHVRNLLNREEEDSEDDNGCDEIEECPSRRGREVDMRTRITLLLRCVRKRTVITKLHFPPLPNAPEPYPGGTASRYTL